MDRKDAFNTVRAVATEAVRNTAEQHDNSLSPRDAPVVAEAVTQKLAPIIAHATNNEPWYQSRVTWGAILAAAAPIAVALGFDISWINSETLAALGAGVGAAITIYGRWRARKPLGLTSKG